MSVNVFITYKTSNSLLAFPELILLIEGSEFANQNTLNLWVIHIYLDTTLDTPEIDTFVERIFAIFGTLK